MKNRAAGTLKFSWGVTGLEKCAILLISDFPVRGGSGSRERLERGAGAPLYEIERIFYG